MRIKDPEQLCRLFADRVNTGDLEGLVALYEEQATFVGPDGVSASGIDAIRERLEDLLAMAPRITATSSRAVVAGDIALMFNGWQMSLTAGEGELAGLHGKSTEVARQQPGGGWLYAIDNPAFLETESTAPVGITSGH